MADCISKTLNNDVYFACKSNKRDKSDLSYDAMGRLFRKTEYLKEMLPTLEAISSPGNSNLLSQGESHTVITTNPSVSTVTISGASENAISLQQQLITSHNNAVAKVNGMKVTITFTNDHNEDLSQRLNDFINEQDTITAEEKAAFIASDEEDTDDINYALTSQLDEISLESGIQFNALPSTLFIKDSPMLQEIGYSSIQALGLPEHASIEEAFLIAGTDEGL